MVAAKSEILKVLYTLWTPFKKKDLAYLALTSKPEAVIRDLLAVQLHERLGDRVTVAREWKRIDLALLRGCKPITLVQLKTYSSFTLLEDAKGIVAMLSKDIQKCQKYADNNTDVYSLFIATHIKDKSLIVQNRYGKDVIKYLNKWQAAIKGMNGNPLARLQEKAKRNMNDELGRSLRIIKSGTIPIGSAFGGRVSLLFWLCGTKKSYRESFLPS